LFAAMPPLFPTPVSRFLKLLGVIALSSSTAFSADLRTRHVRTVDEDVPLQPFSLDGPHAQPVRRAMHVAYYAAHALPHAESPRYREDADREDSDVESEPHFGGGSHPIVNGSRALLRNGVAYAPASAPDSVKSAIWAVNTIRTKPYVWGGGHGSFNDRGYDCSGTVSFALYHAGLLGTPLPSSDLMRYGERGRGRWITIYARHGHTFAMIAGLRLDTTDFRYGGDLGPRWHNDYRDTRGFVATHPAGL
jgi:hypothetical protein